MADERPGAFTTVTLTDTTATALVVGAAPGSTTPADNSGAAIATITLKSTTPPSVTTNKIYNNAGVLSFNGAALAVGTVTNTGTLTTDALIIGNGGVDVEALASLGTTTTVLHGNAAGPPTFAAVSLTADVAGILPSANGGTALAFFAATGPLTTVKTFTFPNVNSIVLTDATPVSVPQGGTGLTTLTANGIVLGAGSSTPTFLAPGTTGNVAMSNGTIWQSTAPATPAVTLLIASSGTSVSEVAANVATIAVSGLTAKDTIVVYYTLGMTTQLSGSALLYNTTDSVTIVSLSSGAVIAAGSSLSGTATIRQRQTAATAVWGAAIGMDSAPVVRNDGVASTFTQNWTGSWTLGLRFNGVVAGGTLDWSWAVFKVAGQ